MQAVARDWNERHLSEEELIAALYDAGPTEPHLEACLYCRGRLQMMEHTRGNAVTQEEAVNERFLAGQRASIYSKLGDKRSPYRYWLWAGAPLAAAAVLVMTVKMQTTEPVLVETQAQVAVEETLYTDIYQTLQETPAGVYEVAGMFETSAGDTGSAKN